LKLLFTGASGCDYETLKRLNIVADEIGFMDRPSVVFKNWGTIGHDSFFRRFRDTDKGPVKWTVHAPPSGPARFLYERYIDPDLANPDFRSRTRRGRLRSTRSRRGSMRWIDRDHAARPRVPERDGVGT